MENDFRIDEIDVDAETHVVVLGGEVDLQNAPLLERRMGGACEAGKRRLIVDLTDATFIDSTTLRVLVSVHQRLDPVGGEVCVVAREPSIVKIFEITGLDGSFALHASREEALAALKGA